MWRRGSTPKRWTLWASGALLVFVAGCAVTVFVVKSIPSESDSSTPAPKTPQATVEASGCPAGPVEMQGRLDVAPQVAWDMSGQATFPVPPESEPSESGVWECFSRTPTGAVLAASAGMTQLSSASPEIRRAVVESRFAPGPVRDETLASVSGSSTSSSPSVRLQASGFRLSEYSGSAALVDVAFTGYSEGQTVYLSMLVPLRWDEEQGDWLFDYGSYDQLPPAQLPNLTGYVQWPAGADVDGQNGW